MSPDAVDREIADHCRAFQTLKGVQSMFDSPAQKLDDGAEFWYARDLQKLLGYTNWQNFYTVIGRAVESCETAKIDSNEHFSVITKMITLGQGGKRGIRNPPKCVFVWLEKCFRR